MITKTMSICSNVGHFAGYQTGKKQVKLFQKLIYFHQLQDIFTSYQARKHSNLLFVVQSSSQSYLNNWMCLHSSNQKQIDYVEDKSSRDNSRFSKGVIFLPLRKDLFLDSHQPEIIYRRLCSSNPRTK